MDTQPILLTVQEVSKLLNVKESWLRSQIFKREIPFIKLGSLIRFDLVELNQWIQESKNRDGPRSG